LLTPKEIRSALKHARMNQRELAERIGFSEETLSRWLNEVKIQSSAMDNRLRAYFGLPQVRTALKRDAQDPHLSNADRAGQRKRGH
jgi:transcriptional regulator with XRE-family HTH domain